MSIYGWIWFAIFGLGCGIALALTLSLWALLLIPCLFIFAQTFFRSAW